MIFPDSCWRGLGYWPILLLAACVFTLHVEPALAFEDNQNIILTSEWPERETGSSVLALPQIRAILKNFDESREDIIEIRFPGGELGRLWGESAANWLTAFGVPQKHLLVLPGSGAADRLVLEIIPSR